MGQRGPRDLWVPPVRWRPLDNLVHRTRHLGGGRAHLCLRVALSVEEPRHLSAGLVKLWIAQGFGVGRILVAPGTFGSVVGVLWFGLLLMTRSLWLFTGGTIAGIALSVDRKSTR